MGNHIGSFSGPERAGFRRWWEGEEGIYPFHLRSPQGLRDGEQVPLRGWVCVGVEAALQGVSNPASWVADPGEMDATTHDRHPHFKNRGL